ncbi:glutathione S-transferase family protein [Aggregicoccus sp. 17bor-14]|uniref:glutathione S-transferase family protein n=1 Tax=Myxococcaceae TaxID=31 RepID=UPI00129C844A|nr:MULTISPECIES: glutathione S-transferase family protein [Myxococcaceae]MBF5046505.1 glutathione S-transferase family protein [Simulacricoccus sp. 17bor-14]MRI92221.1 glutathione S-transferase family protein [Aggregicoccus sp. 17bor-14]
MLTLYGFSRVNRIAHGRTRDLRILWALEEMGLPYRIEGMDHPAGDFSSEAFRALNPFQQLPVLDDDGVVLSESGAILLHLARKSGKLYAPDEAGQASVLRWCFVALSTLEPPLAFFDVLSWDMMKGPAQQRDFVQGWAGRHLGGLERWLEGREFVATEEFTVADLLVSHVLSLAQEPALLAPCPRVAAYRERCLARPAWAKVRAAYEARVQKD